MIEFSLAGLHILVVEDEYLIADDVKDALHDRGAIVLGPVPTVEEAMKVVVEGGHIDAAMLDINLRGTMVFDVADALWDRHIPFIFATGYDDSGIPERFGAAPRIEKPIKARHISHAFEAILKDGR